MRSLHWWRLSPVRSLHTSPGRILPWMGNECLNQRRNDMRAMRAETFSGYEGLKLIELPKPAVTKAKLLVRITAAGVTPLDHTILSGKFHGSKAPRSEEHTSELQSRRDLVCR